MTETGLGGERHPGEPPRTSGQFVSKYKKAPGRHKAAQTHEVTYSFIYCLISHPYPDCPGGGATLFLAGAGHVCCEKRQKWTRRYLLSTAVSSKKGDFNTPSVFLFFKRKRRSEICYFKTAVRLLYFVLAHEYPATETTVFFISAGWLYSYRKVYRKSSM